MQAPTLDEVETVAAVLGPVDLLLGDGSKLLGARAAIARFPRMLATAMRESIAEPRHYKPFSVTWKATLFANPNKAIEAIDGVKWLEPLHAQLTAQLARVLNFIMSAMPKQVIKHIVGVDNVEPSSFQWSAFCDQLGAINDPVTVCALISAGTLSKDEAAAFRQCNPNLYAAMVKGYATMVIPEVMGREGADAMRADFERGLATFANVPSLDDLVNRSSQPTQPQKHPPAESANGARSGEQSLAPKSQALDTANT